MIIREWKVYIEMFQYWQGICIWLNSENSLISTLYDKDIFHQMDERMGIVLAIYIL